MCISDSIKTVHLSMYVCLIKAGVPLANRSRDLWVIGKNRPVGDLASVEKL